MCVENVAGDCWRHILRVNCFLLITKVNEHGILYYTNISFLFLGKRVFLNISFFDFGYGAFDRGISINTTGSAPEDSFLEVQVDLQSMPIRPFLNQNLLTSGLFVSNSEILRIRLRTGENVTGVGFVGQFKTGKYFPEKDCFVIRGSVIEEGF